MLTKIGTALNYKDLFYQYMSFLTCDEIYDEGCDSWCIIDPRLDSFYGATLAIPTGDYIQKDDTLKIWIDDSESLFSSTGTRNLPFYDDACDVSSGYNNLTSTLKHCYPNSTVDLVCTGINQRGIEELYRLLQNTVVPDFPDVVISFGLLSTVRANGTWNNYVDIELNNLFTFCLNNNIKLYCCVAPSAHNYQWALYDSVYNDIEKFISNTGERLINLPSKYIDMFYTLADLQQQFPNFVYGHNFYDNMSRILLQEHMGLDRPEYFVSFEYRGISSSSYKNFLYNYSDYQSEEFDKTENGYYDHGRKMMVERKIASKDDAKNPFKHNGQLVATGLHTSYDHKLWMCEQGGITCKKEADEQINDIDLLPFWQYWSGSPQKRRDIPVYPGTGCPWVTIADVDISKYGVGSSNPINYYFTKNNLGSTITIRICDSGYTLPDIWQSLAFGRFTHTKDVIYPLYVGGGSLPLSPDWWLYYAMVHTYGQLYNLSMKNPALANSNILHTTKFGKANLSNFRVMDASGFWRDIYSAYQEYKDIQYFVLTGIVFKWAEVILEHTYNYTFNTGAELVDTSGKIGNSMLFKDSENFNKAYSKYFEKDVLDNITIQLNSSSNDNISISQGVLLGIYASWGRNLPEGINNIDGRSWLAIPNGWQDRLWHYKFYYGRIYWEGKNLASEYNHTPRGLEQLEYVRDEYHVLASGRENGKMINDKLVIDFGEAPIECNDLQISFPSDYPTRDEAGLVLRAYIHADSDTVLFNLYNDVNKIKVDFGDGTLTYFDFGDQIKHTYTTTGDYYINIYVANASYYYHCLKYDCSTYDTGLIYTNTRRRNLLKRLYISPYCPEAIYINDIRQGNQRFAGAITNVIYILNQDDINELYLPYLAIRDVKYSGNINTTTSFTWFTVVNCPNLNDIYIFKDFVRHHEDIRDRSSSAYVYIANIVNLGFSGSITTNIHVADGIKNVFVNSSANISVFYSEFIALNNITQPLNEELYRNNVNLYLYNKNIVDVDYLLHRLDTNDYSFPNISMHVPSNLYNDYLLAYSTTSIVTSIIGDIV